MTASLINGRAIAQSRLDHLRQRIARRIDSGLPRPGLAVVLVGEDAASKIYVRNKRRRCEEAGIASFALDLPVEVSEARLLEEVDRLNNDPKVHGILVQLPLPEHIDESKVIEAIDPVKDVDGFHPCNVGRLALRNPLLRPCTPQGVMVLLKEIGERFKGRHAVVVGASNIVGRPMTLELLLAGATVTCCHRFTTDLPAHVGRGDILVAAVGKPGIISGQWVKQGATVIDVGINRLADGSLTGDIDFDTASQRAAWITPVPGGVGPMTVAVLLSNTYDAAVNHD